LKSIAINWINQSRLSIPFTESCIAWSLIFLFIYVASTLLRCRKIVGGTERKWRRYERWLKSQWRPSQSRKESILNCLLRGKWCYIYKSKGGIRSRNIRPLGRGYNIGGNKREGVRTTAASVGELTERGKRKLNNCSLFETTLSLKSEKYPSAKKRVNERVLQ